MCELMWVFLGFPGTCRWSAGGEHYHITNDLISFSQIVQTMPALLVISGMCYSRALLRLALLLRNSSNHTHKKKQIPKLFKNNVWRDFPLDLEYINLSISYQNCSMFMFRYHSLAEGTFVNTAECVFSECEGSFHFKKAIWPLEIILYVLWVHLSGTALLWQPQVRGASVLLNGTEFGKGERCYRLCCPVVSTRQTTKEKNKVIQQQGRVLPVCLHPYEQRGCAASLKTWRLNPAVVVQGGWEFAAAAGGLQYPSCCTCCQCPVMAILLVRSF